METREYDLVVLGSGPAGEKGAVAAATFRKKVAVVEKERVFGGAAANTGTLPSKTLRETAVTLTGFRSRELYGVDLSLRRDATVQDFLYHEKRVIEHERERISANLTKSNIDHFQGQGEFEDPYTIQIKGEQPLRLKAQKILIATGSSPLQPPLFDFPDPRIWDSDQILSLSFMPKRLAIVGAGVIGTEYACIFAALGAQVSLIDGRDRVLGFLDEDIVGALLTSMKNHLAVNFILNERVKECHAQKDADGHVTLTLASGNTVEVDAVLVAAGRKSNTANLNLEKAGVKTGKNGLVEVDENYRTNVEHIYAAGDVIGFPALASTSMDQARKAMTHAFNLPYNVNVGSVLPYGIYTIPEVSTVGASEQTLQKKGVDYVAGRAYYRENARGQIIGDTEGFLKLLFARDDMRLLGASIVGESASDLIHVALMALLANLDSQYFTDACFNYPTLSQMYKYAAYDALRQRDNWGKEEGMRHKA